MAADDPPNPPMRDVVFVHGANDEGTGVRVIRKREDAIEVGELRAPEEGKPVYGDLVKLTQRKEHERLFDVETIVPRPTTPPALEAKAAGNGPAQVASERYRENWDAIFKKPERGPVN